ncbi:hypothetical protein DB346_23375 [Verrucomicrobia bacterium LW23]|nr:hypothetical protein DB346_23375 [Verrucomicrobia bacterium LW23]
MITNWLKIVTSRSLSNAAILSLILITSTAAVSAQGAEYETLNNSGGKPGYIKVCSAKEERPNGEGSVTYIHSIYEIYREDGSRVRQVLNRSEKPDKVQIPAGDYVIVADFEGKGILRVPATVKDGRVTYVCFEGHQKP